MVGLMILVMMVWLMNDFISLFRIVFFIEDLSDFLNSEKLFWVSVWVNLFFILLI